MSSKLVIRFLFVHFLYAIAFCYPYVHCSAKYTAARQVNLCGVYAVFGLLDANGISTDIDKLLVQENISSETGSTAEDICRMLRNHGLNATIVGSASRHSLEASGCVAILNLRARTGASCSGHWVAFLGLSEGEAVLFDYSRLERIYRITFADLMTRWDGAAVICSDKVSESPFTFVFFRTFQIAPRLSLFAICFLLFAKFRRFTCSRVLQLFFLVVVTSLVAVSWQIFDSSSVLCNLDSSSWMAVDQNDDSIASCNRTFTEVLCENRPFVLIDARPFPYCLNQTLPGAKFCGIDRHLDEFRLELVDIDKAAPVVVYCQSKQCPWAELIAKRLRALGYKDISVFVPGVNGISEYLAMQGTRE